MRVVAEMGTREETYARLLFAGVVLALQTLATAESVALHAEPVLRHTGLQQRHRHQRGTHSGVSQQCHRQRVTNNTMLR